MRRTLLAFMVGCLLVLGMVPAHAGKACVVTAWQDGLERTGGTLQTGSYFTLRGTGFKTWSPFPSV